MAVFQRDPQVEIDMAKALGIDSKDVKMGSLRVEYTSGEKDVTITWECIKFMPVEQFNKLMEKHG